MGLTSEFYLLRHGTETANAQEGGRHDRSMKKKLYIYRFSDGSAVVDDADAAMATQHAFCNPSVECVSVEDCRR